MRLLPKYSKMATMTRPVKRLFDLEIDEISLVDRPANQHGLVAIAKRDEDAMPGIFDPDGNPVAEDSLEHGDVVYDEAGNEFVFVEDGEDDTTAELQSGHDYEQEPERELALVGKRAGRAPFAKSTRSTAPVSKGLGASVYEALSKALGDEDRNEVVSKLAEEVEITKAENEYLREQIQALAGLREDDEFLEIAKSYSHLPVHPVRLANILKSAAATMDDEDLAELDRLLTAQNDLYEELGSNGSDATSAVLDQVQAMALETVGKSDVTVEQATVALFEANPAAYDEYIVEKGL